MTEDLNIPDPSKACVPLPELVVIACPECLLTHARRSTAFAVYTCEKCSGLGSVLVDRALLKKWSPS